METASGTDSVNPLSDSFYAMYGMTIDIGNTYDTHDNDCLQDKAYPHDNDCLQDNGYNMRNDYTLDSGYKKYNRLNKVNAYGYTQGNGCIKEDGYTNNSRYSKDNGFSRDNGYTQKNCDNMYDGYNQNSNFNKDNGFTKDNCYTQKNAANKYDVYNQENRCSKDNGFTQDNGHNHENSGNNNNGYSQKSDFNMDNGYTKDNSYTPENGGNTDDGYSKNSGYTQDNCLTKIIDFTKGNGCIKDDGYTQKKPHRRIRKRSLEENNVNTIDLYDASGVKYPGKKEWPVSTWKLGNILSSVFVRALLISHNILTVWRVTEDFNNDIFWFIIAANFLLITEGLVIIWKRGGVEYSWWCPCFMTYLATTIPAIWLLQLNQYNALVSESERVILFHSSPNVTEVLEDSTSAPITLPTSPSYTTTTAQVTQKLVTVLFMRDTNGSINDNNIALSKSKNDTTLLLANSSGLFNTTMSPGISSTSKELTADSTIDTTITSETWIIIVEEALIYLLVLCRWLLPRGEVSREFLADLLLEFLAIASDIMELLAVFDEEEVRSNLPVTLWIMAVWSASFIQFIPILMQKRRSRSFRNSPEIKCIVKNCGNTFVEIVVTCMSIFVQDGPFLVLRMYIIIKLRLVTYSLVFFVLKNIVTLLLYFYRLIIMCYKIRVCLRKKNEKEFEKE